MVESMFYIARQEYECPHCGAKKGEYCMYPSGRKKDPPHGLRIRQLTAKDVDRCKIGTKGG